MPNITLEWDQINSLAPLTYVKNIKDQFFGLNAAWYRARKRVKYKSGPACVVPLSFSTEGGGGQWYKGADRFDTRVYDPFTAAVYHWANAVVPIVVTGDDELSVTGPERVEELFTAKFNVAKNTMIDLLGGASGYFNDGTDPKAIGGLRLAIPAPSGGIFPTQSYGGISAQSYTWWQSQIDATAYTTGPGGNFPGDSFDPLENMLTKIELACDRRPTMGLTNWGSYSAIRRHLIKNERYGRPQQDSDLARVGFKNVLFADIPIVADRRAPRVNKIEQFRFIDEKSMHLIVHPERDMKFDPFVKPIDQDARVAKIYMRCQVGFDERRSSGCIGSIDTTATS